jgi:hypothetical protein
MIAVAALPALVFGGCARQEATPDPAAVDSVARYAALDSGAAANWQSDPQYAAMIGKFPQRDLIANSFERHPSAFLGIEGLDEVISARYLFERDSLILFLTEDRTGFGFLRLSEFAASQSQVRPAPIAFDEGYSVVFHHRQRGWMLGGLKSGYLLGAADYRDSSLVFISRWVKSLE